MESLKKILFGICVIVLAIIVLSMFANEEQNEKAPITRLSVNESIMSNSDISMVVSLPGDLSEWTIESFEKNYKTVKDSGVSIAFTYWNWGEIENRKGEYSWGETDFNLNIIKKNNLKSSVVIKLIDTNQVGELPKDIKYKSFNDEEFKTRFKTFIIGFLDRYHGKIDYLWIGNEIDGYFYKHRDEFDDYVELYKEIYSEIKKNHPEIKIGVISTYHDAKQNNALNLIENISKHGDLIGFSLYPQMLHKQPKDTEELFAEMSEISTRIDKKFAITETAWSANGFGGSEDLQAEYIKELFKAYKNHKDRIEYLGFFTLYDFPEEINRIIAKGYGIGNKEFIKWQGSLGLAYNNGTSKKAWDVFLEEMRK